MNRVTCSIFFHNYYGQHAKWIKLFCEKMNAPFNLFYNIVEDSIYNLEDDQLSGEFHNNTPRQYLNKIILRKSSNQGKDIGGKLVLMDAYLHSRVESEYIIFLHDKRSPYKIQNEEWQKKLFSIIEPSFMKEAMNLFNKKKEIGIITGSESINNEYDYSSKSFISNNKDKLVRLQSEFNINTTDYRYVSGTMFWARSLPLLSFFRKNPPLETRKDLEKGNIMDESEGSNTHAWERLLSWLIIAQGYNIKGL